jgi:hypothetical protein
MVKYDHGIMSLLYVDMSVWYSVYSNDLGESVYLCVCGP